MAPYLMGSMNVARPVECSRRSGLWAARHVYKASLKRPGRAHATYADVDDALKPGLSYSAQWNELYWRTRPVTVQKRLIQIGWSIAKWQAWKQLNASPDAPYLLKSLAELGPAFVKIGQAVSTRPDVVPPDYLRELEKLQDNIPPFPSSEAFAVIEEDLGQPVDVLFSNITPEPVAAASLGQVYKATLRETGEVVAVKVQRPGVIETIALDIYILRTLGWWFRKLAKLNSDLPGLIDEWAASIYREMSYLGEARNAVEFKELFSHYAEIYVPTVYNDYTSERVLTMEWVDGSKPRSGSENQQGYSSPDDLKLVEVGVRCSLEQMLQEGFYHADPHPGNILRMDDGRLCYLDFGMMGRIDRPVRQALIRATMHLVNGEFEYLSRDFVTLGMLPENAVAAKEEIVDALTGVFEEAIARGVGELSFGGLSAKLGRTMYKYKFRIPNYFTLLVRSFAILEGIALAVDPNYKVLSAAYPWISRRLLTDRSTELQSTVRSLLYKDGMFNFARLESLLRSAVKSPGRPPRTLPMASSNGTNGTYYTSNGTGPAVTTSGPFELLLAEDGEFLRDIVLDELAKGIDAAWRVNLDNVQQSARTTALSFMGLQGQEQNIIDGEYDSLPAARLVSFMLAAPPLSNASDVAQIRGITSLIVSFQELRGGSAMEPRRVVTVWAGSAPADTHAFLTSTAALLQWIADEARKLPPAAQQRALLLPGELLGRIASRAAARTLRLLLETSSTNANRPVAVYSKSV